MARRVATSDERRVTSGEKGQDAPLFRRTPWKAGQMNYECRLCAFATLEPVKMQQHLRAAHGISGGTAPAGETDGTPIILIEENEVK